MRLRNEILSILLDVFNKQQGQWSTADELRSFLAMRGILISPQELSEIITKLRDQGYVEIVSVFKEELLNKGFVVRMTVKGRNMRMHGVASLTGT